MNDDRNTETPAPSGAGAFYALKLPAVVLDLIVCIALGALGIWFIVEATTLPDPRRMIGPGTFPMIAGALLTTLCIAQAVVSIRDRNTDTAVPFSRPLALPFAMALMLAFPFAMDSFGYYLTAVIWVPAFAWVAGMREIVTMAIITAIVLALARFVFQMLLGTPLP